MSRIRSIHPGLFTDDDYMALSFPARELIKGIWVEADDNGIFEWKLRTIKARIMPADNVDMDELAAELVKYRFIRQFEADGKAYGAVRNFCRYQRPKEPNPVHPIPDTIKAYVCHGYKRGGKAATYDDNDSPSIEERYGDNSPELSQSFPRASEISGQMEEGRGKMEDGEDVVVGARAPERDPIREAMECIGAWDDPNCTMSGGHVLTWIAQGADLDMDILPTLRAVTADRRAREGPRWMPSSMSYFRKAIMKAVDDRINPPTVTRGTNNGNRTRHNQSPHEALFAGAASVAAPFRQDGGDRP